VPDARARSAPAHRGLLASEHDAGKDYTPTFFLEAAGSCAALSVAGGLALGLASLALVRRHPHTCVGAAVGLQVRGRVGWRLRALLCARDTASRSRTRAADARRRHNQTRTANDRC
jgi:hypothetical protein